MRLKDAEISQCYCMYICMCFSLSDTPYSSELLNLHRYFFEELSKTQFLPASVQLDQFFSILERMFPNFSLYNPFLDGNRQENVQVQAPGLYYFLYCCVHDHTRMPQD